MLCFNCDSPFHFSFDCEQPQRLSRCQLCRRVCTKSSSHANWCENKDWTSTSLLSNDFVIQPRIIAEIGFEKVKNVTIIDKTDEKTIDDIPLLIANADTIVYEKQTRLLCTTYVRERKPLHINIFDDQSNLLVHAEITKKYILVNECHRIDENGISSGETQNVRDHGKICLKVNGVIGVNLKSV